MPDSFSLLPPSNSSARNFLSLALDTPCKAVITCKNESSGDAAIRSALDSPNFSNAATAGPLASWLASASRSCSSWAESVTPSSPSSLPSVLAALLSTCNDSADRFDR